MTSRNRTIAAVGLWKLGEGLDAVLKLLPPARRDAILRHREIENGRDSGSRGVRLRTLRKREQLRIEKILPKSSEELDPRVRQWMIDRLVTSHGVK